MKKDYTRLFVAKIDIPHAEWPTVGQLRWIEEPVYSCERQDNWIPIWAEANALSFEYTTKDNPDNWFG